MGLFRCAVCAAPSSHSAMRVVTCPARGGYARLGGPAWARVWVAGMGGMHQYAQERPLPLPSSCSSRWACSRCFSGPRHLGSPRIFWGEDISLRSLIDEIRSVENPPYSRVGAFCRGREARGHAVRCTALAIAPAGAGPSDAVLVYGSELVCGALHRDLSTGHHRPRRLPALRFVALHRGSDQILHGDRRGEADRVRCADAARVCHVPDGAAAFCRSRYLSCWCA